MIWEVDFCISDLVYFRRFCIVRGGGIIWFISISGYSCCMTTKIIFICKANVGRSQIAEWIYNSIYWSWSSISFAGSEARKEKYLWFPDTWVSKILKEYKWVDISSQKIQYLSDININQIQDFDVIVFLYDPKNEAICDDKCKLYGKTPYEYIKTLDMPIVINPIKDPFEVGSDKYKMVIDEIENFIYNFSFQISN